MLGGAEWFPTAGAPMLMTKLREKRGWKGEGKNVGFLNSNFFVSFSHPLCGRARVEGVSGHHEDIWPP